MSEYKKTIKLLQNEIDKYISAQEYMLHCVNNDIMKHQKFINSKSVRQTMEVYYVIKQVKSRKDELKSLLLWRTEYNERLQVIKKLDICLDLRLNDRVLTSKIRTDVKTDATTEVAYKTIKTTVLIKRLTALSESHAVRNVLIPQLAFKALKILKNIELEALEPYNL